VEQARLIDKAKWLNTLFLDAQLVTAIKRGAAKGDIRAIQMGYQRLGLMRDGEFLDVLTPKRCGMQVGNPSKENPSGATATRFRGTSARHS